MKCPRCGGDMSSGVCEECGFPVTGRKLFSIKYFVNVNEKVYHSLAN